ncbi:hypothetical protein [Candidatus Chlorohelix sp.]|uniref:hypothetical protein n=1 Tax=Candidatus Chlorohelix sp. TaxID=3139201 RepID=UPI003069B6B3
MTPHWFFHTYVHRITQSHPAIRHTLAEVVRYDGNRVNLFPLSPALLFPPI